jgi:putative ABC transport system permease protein
VEHSYLRIFGLLGGLGLLLGSVGMGVVVLRNLGERRREHALLRTLGFPAATVAWLLLLEHAGLFVAGMVVGTASALVAVAPVVAGTGAELALRGTLLLLLATLVVGLLTVGIPGAWVAFRGVSPRG